MMDVVVEGGEEYCAHDIIDNQLINELLTLLHLDDMGVYTFF